MEASRYTKATFVSFLCRGYFVSDCHNIIVDRVFSVFLNLLDKVFGTLLLDHHGCFSTASMTFYTDAAIFDMVIYISAFLIHFGKG